MAIIKKGALVGSIFLFIIIVIFLMYANHLFVKRRTREFALFQLIGLTRQNILKMLALEQMIVFLITGVVGVLCGIAGAQLLLSIVSKLMSLSINLSIHFEPMALVLTIFMLIIAYVLILFQSALFLKRRSILSMMKDSIKTDVTTAKVNDCRDYFRRIRYCYDCTRILYGDRNVWYVQSTNYGYDITVYHFIFNGCRRLFILQKFRVTYF